MFRTRLLGLIISAAALAAGAAPAGAATPPTPAPHSDGIIAVLIGLETQPPPACPSLGLTMPGSSTWGNVTGHVPSGSDGCL